MEIVADKNERNIRTFKATERLLQHIGASIFFTHKLSKAYQHGHHECAIQC